MPVWPVLVQDWQHECCGDPFSVGDEVAWTLVFLDELAVSTPEEMVVEAKVRVEGAGTADDGTSGHVGRVGDELCVWLRGDDPGARSNKLSGMLMEERV